VYWLGRPRYLRWLAAATILVAAFYAEFRPQHMVDHPFAAAAIERGELISAVEWRRVPESLLPVPDLTTAYAAVGIEEGEPLLPSHVAAAGHVPPGWWSIPVAMAFAAPVGTPVQLVATESGLVAEGVIVADPPDDPFVIEPAALVAVPPGEAAALAVAAAAGQVTVLIASN
jgi:hypothetical protein